MLVQHMVIFVVILFILFEIFRHIFSDLCDSVSYLKIEQNIIFSKWQDMIIKGPHMQRHKLFIDTCGFSYASVS